MLVIFLSALAFLFDLLPASLQPPRVVEIIPADNAAEILPTSPITITFSAPMNRALTEGAISFAPPFETSLAWVNNQTLVFTPRTRLPISTTLRVNILQDARSWIQRPLQSETHARFTTLARPYVISSAPARDAQFAYIPNQLRIEFSRAMDGTLVREKLRVEPALQNFSVTTDGRTVIVRGFFEPHTQYKITIPPPVKDAQYGISLHRTYAWTFTAALQYPNFSILNRGRLMKFPGNVPVEIPTQFTNVSRLEVELYSITQPVLEEQANAPFEAWYEFQPATAPTKTWRVETNAVLDKYAQQKILLGALESGAYYLKITSPEGVGDAQLLLIE